MMEPGETVGRGDSATRDRREERWTRANSDAIKRVQVFRFISQVGERKSNFSAVIPQHGTGLSLEARKRQEPLVRQVLKSALWLGLQRL
jgi:hypothetical protein